MGRKVIWLCAKDKYCRHWFLTRDRCCRVDAPGERSTMCSEYAKGCRAVKYERSE